MPNLVTCTPCGGVATCARSGVGKADDLISGCATIALTIGHLSSSADVAHRNKTKLHAQDRICNKYPIGAFVRSEQVFTS